MIRSPLKIRRLLLESLECRQVLDGGGLPWLLAPDLTISFAPEGTNVAGYTNSLHETLDSVAPTGAWQDAIVTAFRTWAQHIGTSINVVLDSGNPFGAPGLTQGDPQFGDVRIAAVPLEPDVIAISIPHNDLVSGTWAGDILFNSNAALESIDELFSVALHEAGHVFGLAHSTDPDSVMYWHGISPVMAPTADDVTALQQLYGRTEDIDNFFSESGDGEDDSDGEDGDDDIEHPRALVNAQQLRDAIRFDAAGEINSADDVDYYQLGPVDEALNDAIDDLEVLTVTLWVTDPHGEVPSVQIVKPSGEVVESRVLSHAGGRIVVQTDDVSPEKGCLVKVQAADGTGGAGAYRLSARFGAAETKLDRLAEGTLAASAPAASRVLHVSQTSLMHLALDVTGDESGSGATVTATLSNASGQVLARIDSRPGQTHSAPTFLLNPGDYRVEIAAAVPPGRSLGEIDFTLRGITISIPIGSDIVDPTSDPTTVYEPAITPPPDYTVVDPDFTTPVVVPPPPEPLPVPLPSADADWLFNPWNNLAQPLDVNGDGIVSPSDALAIVNYLNSVGAGTLDMNVVTGLFLDVNNDGTCSAADALCVVNWLNAAATAEMGLNGTFPSTTG